MKEISNVRCLTPDAGDQLSDPNAKVSRIRHFSHQSAYDTIKRSVHHSTPLLDLDFRAIQSEVLRRSCQSDLDHTTASGLGDTAGQIPALKLGEIHHLVSHCWLPLRPCNVG